MASDHPPSLRGDEQELFRSFNERLLRSVRRSVNAPQVIIEEGCGFAWQRLIECQPERSERIFGWLRTVAIREAWRLARRERVAVRLDEPSAADGGLLVHELVADERLSLDGQLDALAALQLVASLPARQHDQLALQIAGFSYAETSAITGDSVRTVDRQLRRAHAHVRGRSPE